MSRPVDAPQIEAVEAAPSGWWAVWRDDAGEVLEPVACWALVSQGGFRWTEALVPYGERTTALELASNRDGYCGLRYFTPGNEPKTAWASDLPQ